jgi:hypothetical protein
MGLGHRINARAETKVVAELKRVAEGEHLHKQWVFNVPTPPTTTGVS